MVFRTLTFVISLTIGLLLLGPDVAQAQVQSGSTAHVEVRATILRPTVLRVSDRSTRVEVGMFEQAAIPKSTVRPCDDERAARCQLVIFDLL